MARNRSQGRRSRSWWARSRNQNLSSNSAACCSEHVTRAPVFSVEDGVWAMMPGCGCLIPFATEGESQGGRAMAPNDRFRGVFTLSLHRLSYTHSPPLSAQSSTSLTLGVSQIHNISVRLALNCVILCGDSSKVCTVCIGRYVYPVTMVHLLTCTTSVAVMPLRTNYVACARNLPPGRSEHWAPPVG